MTLLPPKTDQPVKKNAFVHKLYSMLSNSKLSHLIWWTDTPDANTFALYPSKEFAEALSGYFKHGNVASFVRQLHMYGFHKVSDPLLGHSDKDLPVWEFCHLLGKFKKNDESLLVHIKRRLQLNLLRNSVVDAQARAASTPLPLPQLQPQQMHPHPQSYSPYPVHYAMRNGQYPYLPSHPHQPPYHPQPYYPPGLVLRPPPHPGYLVPWGAPVYGSPYYSVLPPASHAPASPATPTLASATYPHSPHTANADAAQAQQAPTSAPAPAAPVLPVPAALSDPSAGPGVVPDAPATPQVPAPAKPATVPALGRVSPHSTSASEPTPVMQFRKPWDAPGHERPRYPSLLYDPLAAPPAEAASTDSPRQEPISLPPMRPLLPAAPRPLPANATPNLAHTLAHHPLHLQRVRAYPQSPALPALPLPPLGKTSAASISKLTLDNLRPSLIELHQGTRSAPTSLSAKVKMYDLIGSTSSSVFSSNSSISSTSTARSLSFGSVSHLLVHHDRLPSIGPHDKVPFPSKERSSVTTIKEENDKSDNQSVSSGDDTSPNKGRVAFLLDGDSERKRQKTS